MKTYRRGKEDRAAEQQQRLTGLTALRRSNRGKEFLFAPFVPFCGQPDKPRKRTVAAKRRKKSQKEEVICAVLCVPLLQRILARIVHVEIAVKRLAKKAN
jgi:hypothetical protein